MNNEQMNKFANGQMNLNERINKCTNEQIINKQTNTQIPAIN